MILVMAPVNPEWTPADYVNFAASGHILFALCYLNAGLFTVLVVFFFASLYQEYKDANRQVALATLLLIPVYAAINLVVYFSQITIIPVLVRNMNYGYYSAERIAPWLQCYMHSPMAILNGLAYALLGIPSLIFGWLILKKNSGYRLAAYSLVLSAVLSFLGLIGYVADNSVLDKGTVLGGLVFTITVFLFCIPQGNDKI